MAKKHVFTVGTAMAVVIANMIGTGVFTSLGFQLLGIQSGFVLMMLWLVGGVTALCGALSYAELGALFPRSGGEYQFLSKTIHPAAGFTAGWISSTIGFAAPVALSAITFGTYLSSVFEFLSADWLAVGLIVLLTIVHSSSHRNSGALQSVFTVLKVALIFVFVLLGLWLVDEPQKISFLPVKGDLSLIWSSTFAVSLIYVNYAYNGWNAATYLSSELANPQQDLPKILFFSTSLVAMSYLALNFVFLYSAPVSEMQGQLQIGFISAQHIFGKAGAAIMGVSLSLLLVSTVSAMILAGPRVLQVIGEDYKVFKKLAVKNKNGIPVVAIAMQSTVSVLFVLTSSFEAILIFSGFALGLSNFFSVVGLFVMRWKKPDIERSYKTWFYPLTPLVFLSIMGSTLVYLLVEKTTESLYSLGLVLLGMLAYFILNRNKRR
ncbi:MAG: APC family permease [bacterium]